MLVLLEQEFLVRVLVVALLVELHLILAVVVAGLHKQVLLVQVRPVRAVMELFC